MRSDDIGGAVALLAEDVAIELFEPWRRDDYERLLAVDGGQGTEVSEAECVARLPAGGLEVECTYRVQIGIGREVGFPEVEEVAKIRVEDGLITSLRRLPSEPSYPWVIDPLVAWVEEHRPEHADQMECCDSGTVEDARRQGALYLRLAKEWAAYLEDEGRTYDEAC